MNVDIQDSELRITAENGAEEKILHLTFDYLKLLLRDNGIHTLPLRFVEGGGKDPIPPL